MKTITIEKAWGGFGKGAKVGVLGPGDPLQPKAVDPRRADQLVADGFASWTAQRAAEDPPTDARPPEQEIDGLGGVATAGKGNEAPRRKANSGRAKGGRG